MKKEINKINGNYEKLMKSLEINRNQGFYLDFTIFYGNFKKSKKMKKKGFLLFY